MNFINWKLVEMLLDVELKKGLDEKIFEMINKQLETTKIIVKKVAIVDASVVESSKNKAFLVF